MSAENDSALLEWVDRSSTIDSWLAQDAKNYITENELKIMMKVKMYFTKRYNERTNFDVQGYL